MNRQYGEADQGIRGLAEFARDFGLMAEENHKELLEHLM
eukprot:CAMPEP_0206261372 /NCGR_PEP_ID=MMETSP0047_2-20121206/27616_1 /ASSEMBLY_ACC=CAM_ASM_000192 /TAXON_ID=195065 /ORGANISM="Chroomonas mesostigmatica_cf, Strain CCMP1168" /LENGTH=38 /DNA_ID= /DNA_START= /DNA_END= /DNA_ORIENTATION=